MSKTNKFLLQKTACQRSKAHCHLSDKVTLSTDNIQAIIHTASYKMPQMTI